MQEVSKAAAIPKTKKRYSRDDVPQGEDESAMTTKIQGGMETKTASRIAHVLRNCTDVLEYFVKTRFGSFLETSCSHLEKTQQSSGDLGLANTKSG